MKGVKVTEAGHDRVPWTAWSVKMYLILIIFSCHAYNSYKSDINIDSEDIKMVLYMWR